MQEYIYPTKEKNMQKFGLKLKKIKGSCEIYTYVQKL